MIYIAIVSGVYRHEIICGSEDLEKVKAAAIKNLKEVQPDTYHVIEVLFVNEEGEQIIGEYKRKDEYADGKKYGPIISSQITWVPK